VPPPDPQPSPSPDAVPPQSADPVPSPDAVLDALLLGLGPEAAARALAQVANRASARLHTLSRAEAAAHKDQPAWPQWAQLQNAARALVLQASTCRDLAARLPEPPA
jgi:hypothetical protein